MTAYQKVNFIEGPANRFKCKLGISLDSTDLSADCSAGKKKSFNTNAASKTAKP